MKQRICICGHNLLTHDNEIHLWAHIGNKLKPIIIRLTACGVENCRCEKFIETDASKNLKQKK